MNASPWWNMAATIVPPSAMAVWAFIQWFYNRKDKREERENTYEEKRDAAVEKERQFVSQNHMALVADLRAELERRNADIERYRTLLNEKNNDRFHAWDRARFWHSFAWTVVNEMSQTRQIAESAARKAELPPPVWTFSLTLPPFDDAER